MWCGKILSGLIILCGISINAQLDLVEKFKGEWEGTLMVFQNNAIVDSAQVNFLVQTINDTSVTWKLDYKSAHYDVTKDYILRWKKGNDREFYIDEKDGIVLPAFQLDGVLYSDFTYNETFISAVYQPMEDGIFYEVRSMNILEKGDPISKYKTLNTQKIFFTKK